MSSRRILCLWIGMILTSGATAGAQEHGKVGFTMGYPASFGVIFHAIKKVAVRPEFSFSKNTTEGTAPVDGWTVTTGLSALFYVASHDHVHTYLSPRVTYARSSTELAAGATTSAFSSDITNWGFVGSFGAQYSPAPRFSVFGEVGLGYSRQTSKSNLTSLAAKGHQSGTRAGIGVIFYPR